MSKMIIESLIKEEETLTIKNSIGERLVILDVLNNEITTIY